MKKRKLNDSVWITMLTSLASGTALICIGALVIAFSGNPAVIAIAPLSTTLPLS